MPGRFGAPAFPEDRSRKITDNDSRPAAGLRLPVQFSMDGPDAMPGT